MCHWDNDPYHTHAAYWQTTGYCCLSVALPGTGPTGRWPTLVCQVAHESSQLFSDGQTAHTPLGCLLKTCVIVVTWSKHSTHGAYGPMQCMTHRSSSCVTGQRKEPKQGQRQLWLKFTLWQHVLIQCCSANVPKHEAAIQGHKAMSLPIFSGLECCSQDFSQVNCLFSKYCRHHVLCRHPAVTMEDEYILP